MNVLNSDLNDLEAPVICMTTSTQSKQIAFNEEHYVLSLGKTCWFAWQVREPGFEPMYHMVKCSLVRTVDHGITMHGKDCITISSYAFQGKKHF